MSSNHQFVEYGDNVVRRYVKTVPHILSGLRLNPHNPKERMEFLLKTPENNFDFQTRLVKTVDYEEEVLEIYSDTELKVFERLNRSLIESGLLKEYAGEANSVDTTNLLNDDEVNDIAETRQLPVFKSKINKITSVISLKRIRKAIEELNRPVSLVKAVENRIHELTTEDTK